MYMEQNVQGIAQRIWSMVRVIFFMLKKGISKKRLMLDLNMLLKRGNKIASKAINNLMNHQRHAPPREYEFSCSNTPNYTLPFKRRHHHHNKNHYYFDEDAVKMALEMLSNSKNEVAASTAAAVMASPIIIPSPLVRQLRITDSPFPLKEEEDDGDNGVVDLKAEEFIQRFYRELSLEKKRMNVTDHE